MKAQRTEKSEMNKNKHDHSNSFCVVLCDTVYSYKQN